MAFSKRRGDNICVNVQTGKYVSPTLLSWSRVTADILSPFGVFVSSTAFVRDGLKGSTRGKASVTAVPCAGVLSISTLPPRLSANSKADVRPSPVPLPLSFVVKCARVEGPRPSVDQGRGKVGSAMQPCGRTDVARQNCQCQQFADPAGYA